MRLINSSKADAAFSGQHARDGEIYPELEGLCGTVSDDVLYSGVDHSFTATRPCFMRQMTPHQSPFLGLSGRTIRLPRSDVSTALLD